LFVIFQDVIVSFADSATKDIFNGCDSKAARRACPRNLWSIARRKLDQLNAATRLDTLRVPPGNRLEALKSDRAGEHSIRINKQYRLCFQWTNAGADGVRIVDYH
jgi:proteic killer suppression protein